jgi:hypothetical protein
MHDSLTDALKWLWYQFAERQIVGFAVWAWLLIIPCSTGALLGLLGVVRELASPVWESRDQPLLWMRHSSRTAALWVLLVGAIFFGVPVFAMITELDRGPMTLIVLVLGILALSTFWSSDSDIKDHNEHCRGPRPQRKQSRTSVKSPME